MEDSNIGHGCKMNKKVDQWFEDHFNYAGDRIFAGVGDKTKFKGECILDVGCGDGIMDLAIALKSSPKYMVGMDVNEGWKNLSAVAYENLGLEKLPSNLRFVRGDASCLPFRTASFDLIFSWSSFEHIPDYSTAFSELNRVLKKGGYLFVQIHPLYFSAFGSHLDRFVQIPFAHLSYSNEEFKKIYFESTAKINPHQKDQLFKQSKDDAAFKKYLWTEYQRLNKITLSDIQREVLKLGFTVKKLELLTRNSIDFYIDKSGKLSKIPFHDLAIEGIELLLQKAEIDYDDKGYYSSSTCDVRRLIMKRAGASGAVWNVFKEDNKRIDNDFFFTKKIYKNEKFNKEYLIEKIKEIGPWEYFVDFGEGITTGLLGTFDETTILYHRYRSCLITDTVAKLLGDKITESSILDTGCHCGLFSLDIASRNAKKVVGFDVRKRNVIQAKFLKNYFGFSNVEFTESDLYNFTPDEQFTVVYNLGLLYHVVDPVGLIERTYNWSKDFVVIDTLVTPGDDCLLTVKTGVQISKCIEGTRTIEFRPTRRALIEMIKAVGFKKIMQVEVPGVENMFDYKNKYRQCLICFKNDVTIKNMEELHLTNIPLSSEIDFLSYKEIITNGGKTFIWYFDQEEKAIISENWQCTQQLTHIENKNFNLISQGMDPILVGPVMTNFSLKAKFIIVEMSIPQIETSNMSNIFAEIFWRNNPNDDFRPEKSIAFNVKSGNKFHKYKLDLQKCFYWENSPFLQLRLDPLNTKGKIKLKSIDISEL
jgi:ubiquinone/menaquinone biosynthesis C-methylase UbiE